MRPDSVKRDSTNGIEVSWPDGLSTTISSKVLRDNCPSAASKQKRGDNSHDKPLGLGKLVVVKEEAATSYSLEKIWLVGNYALGMRWSDGHDSGIFTFDFLRELSESVSDC